MYFQKNIALCTERIEEVIIRWTSVDAPDLILTSGGTGFGLRDNTPETIRPLLHREAPGVAQALINEGKSPISNQVVSDLILSKNLADVTNLPPHPLSVGLKHTPLAVLSRPVVGTRNNVLICTLPGRLVVDRNTQQRAVLRLWGVNLTY